MLQERGQILFYFYSYYTIHSKQGSMCMNKKETIKRLLS